MGQNVYGLPKGIATALDEIARNTAGGGARRKYRTEDDYYNEMINRGKTSGFGVIKDPKMKRLYNRAKERYNKEHPREYKLKTVNDMVMFLAKNNGQYQALWQAVGLNVERHEMAKRAIDIYQKARLLQMDNIVSDEDLKEYK